MKLLLAISFIFVILLSSCNRDPVNKILKNSTWAIDKDSIIWHGNDIFYCYALNTISFRGELECEIPKELWCDYIGNYDFHGNYTIEYLDSIYYINFETNDKVFNGLHEIYFEKDERLGLLKMIIKSEHFYMKCTRILFSINGNESLINKLPHKIN